MLIKGFSPLRHRLTQLLAASSLLPALIGGVPCASADPVPVRAVSGTIHGFLELRSADGHIVASGDTTRVVSGNNITSRIVFLFKDGSIDDETTIYSRSAAPSSSSATTVSRRALTSRIRWTR